MMPVPKSVDEVIEQLDLIIAWCKERQSAMGYFAMLYRRMTAAVRDGIKAGMFSDAARMEKLDIVFASRYLDAWTAYTEQRRCTNAWWNAFEACNNSSLVVLQHLLVGVNAHINLDLGIAAATIAPGETIFLLQNDFEKINDVIASLTQSVEESLCRIWFPLRAITQISNRRQDAILNFSITTARKTAWANAVALAFIEGDVKETHINTIDGAVVTIGQRIASPGMMTELLLYPVREMENKQVAHNILLLES
jgi:Family of unknown function (DUF5995)